MEITKADIDELERLGREAVPQTGHWTVIYIVQCLRRNDIQGAQTVYRTDGDKLWSYNKIRTKVESILGCRTHLRHNCQAYLCRYVRS
jgi:hypothetical protein